MHAAPLIAALVGYASLGIAAGYSVVALTAVLAWRRYVARSRYIVTAQPPVTVLKPLCGEEPGLYEHLRSFCLQDYAQYQIVFGTLDASDPALGTVDRGYFSRRHRAVRTDRGGHRSGAAAGGDPHILGRARDAQQRRQ